MKISLIMCISKILTDFCVLKQTIKIKSGSISYKNYLKQVPVSFKIYADLNVF